MANKETPIIMSGNHPKLILDGKKTMTRRTYGLEKVNRNPDDWEFKRLNNGAIALFWRSNIMDEDIALCKCPYGQVGDRLWVRETYYPVGRDNMPYLSLEKSRKSIIYKADDMECLPSNVKWKPSIFMPRWASRITLEITDIRVERVQEITQEDAEKEGVSWSPVGSGENPEIISAVENFATLWDSINAKRGYGWDTNPWVWVISFTILE